VVVVFTASVVGFVADVTAADVDALDEAVLDEEVEDAVDTGDPDVLPFAAQLVEDLHGGNAAGLTAEQFDDREPRAALAEACCLQAGDGVLGPAWRLCLDGLDIGGLLHGMAIGVVHSASSACRPDSCRRG
jgi:hypothetical protein